jgi:hypothetical protein
MPLRRVHFISIARHGAYARAMLHSARWRAKAMTFVKLAQSDVVLRAKRRYLDLATSCMRYSVRLDIAAVPPSPGVSPAGEERLGDRAPKAAPQARKPARA